MLSFKKGSPVAIIKGGRYNGKVVRVHSQEPVVEEPPKPESSDDSEDDDDSDSDDEYFEDVPFDYPSLLKHKIFQAMPKPKRIREYDRIHRLAKRRKKPRRKDALFNRTKKVVSELSSRELTLNGAGVMIPIPNPDKMATNYYTGGPNGCGKSTAMASWARAYHKLHKKNKIYMFKRDAKDDPAFDGIKFIEEDIREALTDPFDLDEMENSLLIFDDVGRIGGTDKKLRMAIRNFIVDALENGRKKHISVCISNHLIADSSRTKELLFESDVIVVFKGSSNHQIDYVMKRYAGMSPKDIVKLKALPSRWVLINKSYPQHVIYNKGIYVI